MGKILSEVFGRALSMAISLFETFIWPARCPFTGWFIVMMSADMSIQRSFRTSLGSAKVSFNVWREVAIRRLWHEAMSWSSSFSLGTKGKLSSCLYFGGIQAIFSILVKAS